PYPSTARHWSGRSCGRHHRTCPQPHGGPWPGMRVTWDPSSRTKVTVMSASLPAGSAPTPSLLVRTHELDAGDLSVAELIVLVPEPGGDRAHVGVRRGDGLVGWGEAARIAARGPDRFSTAVDAWQDFDDRLVVRDPVGLPGTG